MPLRRWLIQIPWRTKGQVSNDFEEELALHRELRVAELIAHGRSPAEATTVTEREFGDLDDARRYVHAMDNDAERTIRRRDLMHDALDELRYVLRRLRRSPLYAITAILTLTLGIGACVLMFNIVTAVLITPPPYAKPDRVVMIWGDIPQIDLGFPEQPIAGRYFSDIRASAQQFESLAAFRAGPFNLELGGAGGGGPERVDGLEATGDFFAAIGVSPALGRFFTLENELPGNDQVVVISDELWHRSFGGDRGVVGRTVMLNAKPYTVIGVAPPDFAFPRGPEMPGDFQFAPRTLLWVPIEPPKRGPSDLAVVGRMKPGVAIAQARADLARAAAIEVRLHPEMKGWAGTMAVPLDQQMVGHTKTMLFSLLAAVGLLLVLACVNTAQLQVARMQSRRREFAVRAALGASRARLASELGTELVALIGAGWSLGCLLAWYGLRLARSYGGERIPRLDTVHFDPRAAVAALITAGIVGIAASAVPGFFAARVPLIETLRRGGRGVGGGSGASTRARRWLVGVEIALSVVLVACAGLLVRSLSRELGSATGFTAPGGLTFELTLPAIKYPEKQGPTYMEHPAAAEFYAAALDRIRQLPGVETAAIGKPLPLSGAQEASAFWKENAAPLKAGEPTPVAEYTLASGDLFKALGAPLLAGRDFDATDRLDAAPVVIVNQAMAEWLWPGESAVGKRIKLGGAQIPTPWMTVIGVSANMKRYSLVEAARPEMIVPYTQNPYPSFLTMQVVIRSRLGTGQLLPELRRAIGAVDPTVPISNVRTIAQLIGETSVNARFATRLMSAFGVSALALAMIGIYGLMAFTVQQRRHEFGVRRALGATPREVMRLVLRESVGLASGGVVVGLVVAIAAGVTLRHLLYQVTAYDPLTLGGTVFVLGLATLAACVGPAWRAARVEERVALEEG